MEYICIGKIVNTHGIKGEVKIQSYSDFDDVRYKKGNEVFVLYNDEYVSLKCHSFRVHKGNPLVTFEDNLNINDVEKYKNCLIYINSDNQHELKKGEYYRYQLKDLEVIDEESNRVGKVVGIEETNGAQNNMRVRKDDGNEFLIPYIDEFIKNVDLDNKQIMIHIDKGLL